MPDERTRLRDERSRPVVDALRRWLDDALPRVAPQTLTGKALTYLDLQWPKLVPVLDDGHIPLDTNLVENAIRPFVIGVSLCSTSSSTWNRKGAVIARRATRALDRAAVRERALHRGCP